MVKAVIFDACGPLYYRAKAIPQKKEALLKKFGYSGSLVDFERAYETEKFKAYVGQESVPEMFKVIMGGLGVKLSADQSENFAQTFNDIQKQVSPTSDAIATLTTLKQRGLKVCVLTDSFYSEAEKWPWFEAMGMRSLIDCMVSSYDIQRLKSTEEAYDVCLQRLGVSANEVVFVGHQPYEMEGAKKAHITSIAVLPIAPTGITADHKIQTLSELPKLIIHLDDARS